MKTHLDLYGWEIRRSEGGPKGYFNLYLRGYTLPFAGGPPDYLKKVLEGVKWRYTTA